MTSGRNINTPNWLFKRLTDVKVVRKTADETVNNSVALQSDDELLFAIGANEEWQFDVFLLTISSVVADMKVNLSVPAACTYYGYLTSNYGTNQAVSSAILSGVNGFIVGQAVNNMDCMAHFIVINGANAGNVVVQWAQNTAEVSDTKVLANSVIIARRIS